MDILISIAKMADKHYILVKLNTWVEITDFKFIRKHELI